MVVCALRATRTSWSVIWLGYCLCGKTISVQDGWQSGETALFSCAKRVQNPQGWFDHNHKSAHELRVFCYKVAFDQYLIYEPQEIGFTYQTAENEKRLTYIPSMAFQHRQNSNFALYLRIPLFTGNVQLFN